jgi:DNA-binding Lrp family transcriptional regulator
LPVDLTKGPVKLLDDLDQKILAALAADSSTSTSRLARRFKVARSTVQARLERMEGNGTIAGYTIKLGETATVRRIRATVLLQVEARATSAIGTRLKAIPEVEIVHTTSGRCDMIVQIAADTTETLDGVLDTVAAIPGVKETETLVHLATKLNRAV